ncbi:hypothetical protein B0A48_05696 [Cryoendolithus antarcticus]|uniref:Uncharacterized protein n=1 Tax=Cryoendolithus antarcticus TaxID=1507870 RepID=A0A1V8TBP6_9PEZI|nr:hypothetical protein B0A48_05696 [Cryoendolithus antarcticus]
MALCGDNYDITNVENVRAMIAVMKSIGDLGQASKTGSEATSPFTDNGPASFSHAPFNAIEEGTFLHNLPKTEVYKLLIDCMRLRRQDEYFFWTEKDPDARVDPEQ